MRGRTRLFRVISAKKRAEEIDTLMEEYEAAKKMLKTAICRAKEAAWRRLVETVGGDIRGKLYKTEVKVLIEKRRVPKLGSADARKVIKDLFDHPGREVGCNAWDETNWTQADYIEVSEELVGKAIAGLNPRTSLRVDGFLVTAIREATRRFPRVGQSLSQEAPFPENLERRTVGPDSQVDRARYIEICVLSNWSKVLESVIREKLLAELKKEILAPNQFGFRESLSIVHALKELMSRWDGAKFRNQHACWSPWTLETPLSRSSGA